jgi:hypothetical protein
LDKLVAGYLIYNAIYIILPLGNYGIFLKIVAFKNIAFFPFIYFVGRFVDPKKVWLSKYQLMICVLAIVAAMILLIETISDTHLQTLTGYAGYNYKYQGAEPAGNYGLSWTFEIEGGIKRFASIFANPLEHAAATLLTIAVLVSLITKKEINNKKIFIIASFAAILSVIFALSRASLISFGLVLYIYAIVTKRKNILLAFHVLFAIGVISLVYLLSNNTISEFIINTFNFTNSSSISHVIEWVDGIQSIYAHPLGIGMGESGRVAGELGLNVGGENQLIIIAVQTGLISLFLYMAILFISIRWSAILFTKSSGKSKQLGSLLFIFKLGMIIPMLTAAVESYLYISYFSWFLTGLLSTVYENYTSNNNNLEPQ